MSNNSKERDIITELLDEAFDKPWYVYSMEGYKHQLAETQAEIRKLTPDEETKKMNKLMNFRVQATALYRKDRHKIEATRKWSLVVSTRVYTFLFGRFFGRFFSREEAKKHLFDSDSETFLRHSR